MSEELEIIKHVVQKNETLVGIALKYGMKVDQLKKLNRLFSNNTFEGQTLNVQIKKGQIIPTPSDNNNNNNNNKPLSIAIPTTEPILALHLLSSSPSSSLSQLLASSPSPSLAQLLSPSPLLPPDVTISSSSSSSTPVPSMFSASASIPSLLAPPTPNKLKLSTSVPNSSFLDLIGVTLPAERSTPTESGTTHSKLMHKRSEVWDMAGITKPHEVVTCYAKYVPVHGMQVTGVLTITPTRVIFEPNLDDPGVTKDGLLAHQFSVESGRLLEVETFQDDITFRGRLAKQLADQAQWDVPPPKKEKRRNLDSEKSKKNVEGDKQKKNAEGKTERLKRLKKLKPSSSKIKAEDPVIHFDPTTEEMLQIVCSGRYRPKNYANFILPKEKGDVIYQRMVLFLSGSKEERLKAYLNLDVSTPTTSPARGKLRRQHSFSSTRPSDSEALEELKSRYGLADTTVRPEIHQTTRPQVVKRDKQPAPKLKKEKSKTEEKVLQDVEIAKKKRAEAEQAKQLKEQQKKEKKAAKEAAKEASTERRRGSISDKWRSRKTGDPSMKSPPTSPILPKLTSPPTPTSTPPLSPLIVSADTVLPPALDISETTRPAVPVITAADQQEEEAGFLPSLLDESLIFSADDMHELRRYLPGYYKWMDWKLLYSTQNNGISMSTFLHRTREHTPTLFIMEDSNGFVFGGFATAPWAIHTGYFGTGQSFLFSLKPKVHVYEWTRANPFFMLMTPNAIAMGGDKEGRHGFWIDTNFEFGVSEMCSTYFNRCLASTERFKCTIVEVWTLTDGGKDKRK